MQLAGPHIAMKALSFNFQYALLSRAFRHSKAVVCHYERALVSRPAWIMSYECAFTKSNPRDLMTEADEDGVP